MLRQSLISAAQLSLIHTPLHIFSLCCTSIRISNKSHWLSNAVQIIRWGKKINALSSFFRQHNITQWHSDGWTHVDFFLLNRRFSNEILLKFRWDSVEMLFTVETGYIRINSQVSRIFFGLNIICTLCVNANEIYSRDFVFLSHTVCCLFNQGRIFLFNQRFTSCLFSQIAQKHFFTGNCGKIFSLKFLPCIISSAATEMVSFILLCTCIVWKCMYYSS